MRPQARSLSKAAPDFETPGSNATPKGNEYIVIVTVTDSSSGALTDTVTVTVTVTDANDIAPTITSGATGAALAENTEVAATTAIYEATGTFDVDAIVWSLKAGSDTGLSIDSGTGVVTFDNATTPDFETKPSYSFTVVATSGSLTAEQVVTIAVTDVNEAPVITKDADGGIAASTVSDTKAIATIVATDPDSSDTLTYSVTDTDFEIDATSGVLTFAAAPTYDSATAANNTKTVTVTVSDGALSDTVVVTITVTAPAVGPNNAPTFVDASDAEISTLSVRVAENTTAVTTLKATDADAGASLTYSITGGRDAGLFEITDGTTNLVFADAPDFEAPGSAATTPSNIYVVEVTVSDGTDTDVLTLTVTVTDANDVAPAIAGGSTATGTALTENAEVSASTAVYTATGTADVSGDTIAWSLKGDGSTDDAELFEIDSGTGAVTFTANTTPNFEGQASYVFTVVATVGTGNTAQTAEQVVTIAVTDVNEAPVITEDLNGGIAASVVGGTKAIATIAATDPDSDTLRYSVTDTDFEIDATSGVLAFKNPPTYDGTPSADNTKTVTVTVTDDGTPVLTDTVVVTITITAPPVVNVAPVINEGDSTDDGALAVSVAEGVTAVTTISASDGNAGDTLSYALTGRDGALFAIDGDGALTFRSAPDHEAPGSDATPAGNEYIVIVTVSDDATPALTDTVTVTVTVTDANDVAPTIDGGPTATGTALAENTVVAATTAIYTASGTADVSGDSIVWSLKAGSDTGLSIDRTSGAVTFDAATTPNFENKPSYSFTVVATVGSQTAEQVVTIAVTNVNEAGAVADIAITGTPAASAGYATTGNTLTAGAVSDPDGAPTASSLAYQWQEYNEGTSTWDDIASATGNTYTVLSGDAGKDIRVEITYTAGGHTGSVVESTAITVDTVPTGAATLAGDGSPTVNEVLTATNTIADTDGASTLTYAWTKDGVAISGAEAATYTPTAAGDYVVIITATDNTTDIATTFTSNTVTVGAAVVPNNAPTFVDASDVAISTLTVPVVENTTAVTTLKATDADAGASLVYSITGGADMGLFEITTGTTNLVFKTAPDFEARGSDAGSNTYAVEVTVSDGTDTDVLTLTITVTNDDEAGTSGDVTITGTPTANAGYAAIGNTLTVDDPTDLDGAITIVDYEWQESTDTTDGVDGTWDAISGQTAKFYTAAAGQSGKHVRVRTNYTSGGITSFVISAAFVIDSLPVAVGTGLITYTDGASGVTGTADVGDTLTAPTYTDADDSSLDYEYVWKLGTSVITGATGATHVTTAAGEYTVTVKVKDSETGIDTDFTTAAFTVAAAAPPPSTGLINPASYTALNAVDSAGDAATEGADTLAGTAAKELIQGGNEDDTITTGGGDDVVIGGFGADTITLSSGAETVVYRYNTKSTTDIQAADGGDTIHDFDLGTDKFIFVEYNSGYHVTNNAAVSSASDITDAVLAKNLLDRTATHNNDGGGDTTGLKFQLIDNTVGLGTGDLVDGLDADEVAAGVRIGLRIQFTGAGYKFGTNYRADSTASADNAGPVVEIWFDGDSSLWLDAQANWDVVTDGDTYSNFSIESLTGFRYLFSDTDTNDDFLQFTIADGLGVDIL